MAVSRSEEKAEPSKVNVDLALILRISEMMGDMDGHNEGLRCDSPFYMHPRHNRCDQHELSQFELVSYHCVDGLVLRKVG
jgi:hypothetical protein